MVIQSIISYPYCAYIYIVVSVDVVQVELSRPAMLTKLLERHGGEDDVAFGARRQLNSLTIATVTLG